MEINAIGSSQNNSTVKRDIIDKDVFLKILSVELANQDPLNAKDNTQYISQLAQFTSLEQTNNLYASISKLLLSQRTTEGALLIGKNVGFKYNDGSEDGTIKYDIVKSVKIEKGNVYLITEKGKYSIDDVVSVGE
ncbi:flagellar basal-body rod modification protein FlgD [Caloramator quimbayensis]|uniref:Flagellar basal-body rod modification protein FlgD n=1 Tax=Caloramator quimbayensis TaxID=1147123 RepID=A0A1T4XB70_9CLOT|nr:flagellar hook capping FlgD N-terminal domain-containing protein [Caloramator quimbayensis]SKA86378.1 flagellar basal-body rod modification protein FlgD [Caloramator quimbayensis]